MTIPAIDHRIDKTGPRTGGWKANENEERKTIMKHPSTDL